jgi:hypothetical protein
MIKTVLAILVAIISLTHNPAWAEDNQSHQLCLDSSVVQDAAKSDGITDSANPDKFAKSLTSKNNFVRGIPPFFFFFFFFFFELLVYKNSSLKDNHIPSTLASVGLLSWC